MNILKAAAWVPLVLVIGLGIAAPASAKATHAGKAKVATTSSVKTVKKPGRHARALHASGNSSRRKVHAPVQRVSYSRRGAAASAALAAPAQSFGEQAGLNLTHDPLELQSNAAFVIDRANGHILFDKNSNAVLPIASLTKLMTALVVLDSRQNLNEMLTVTEEDVDQLKHSSSRLRVGSVLSRSDMLHIALMSSENRAASALGRNYPGGTPAFVAAMNAKALELGMKNTRYAEPTGLSYENHSTARDLALLVARATNYNLIRDYSTDESYRVEPGHAPIQYNTSNSLVRTDRWNIDLQKTGFINEAGHCMVMQARVDGVPMIMVFLDSRGKYSRFADADRVRRWIDKNRPTEDTGKRALQAQS